MKQLRLQVDTVVGNSTETRWSQAWYEGSEGPGGSLLVALDMVGGELVDLAQFGSSVIESLRELYFAGSSYDLDYLKSVVRRALEEVPEGVEVSIVASCVIGNLVYIVGKGKVVVAIVRGGVVGTVFEGNEEIIGASGFIKEGDGVVVGTADFLGLVGNDVMVEAFESGGPPGEVLAPVIHGRSDSSGMAGLMVRVEKEEKPEVEDKEAFGKKGDEAGRGGRLGGLFKSVLRRRGARSLMVRRPENKKRNMYVAVVLLILLAVSVFFGVVKRSSVLKERRFKQLDETIHQHLLEVVSVADLNPERALYLLRETRSLIDQYREEEKDEGYLGKAVEFYQEIDEVERSALKKSKVELSTLVELSVFRDTLAADKFSLDLGGNVYLVDPVKWDVVGLNLGDKSSFSVGSEGDYEGVGELAVYDGDVYGVDGKGVIRVVKDEGSLETVIEPDELWGDVNLIDMYAGNVYLLDRGEGEIWKYPVLDEGYGARRRWLGKGIVLDLSNVIDMKVTGDIWILTSTGKLERYSRGVPIDYSMEGFGEKFNDPTALFVTEENVYVLERGEKRIVVFGVEGGYQKQIVNEELGSGSDLVVYEGKGYVLSEGSILWFDF